MIQQTLWLDLTMLVHHQGQLTGIQRVEYNLARRFALRPDVRFCVFDKVSRKFFEYDFNHIEAKVAALQASDQAAVHQATPAYAATLRRVIGPVLPGFVKKGVKATYRTARRRAAKPAPPSPHYFKGSETLIILSGDWSDDIFSNTLTKMKEEASFKVVQIVYDLLPAVQPAFFVPGMPEQVSKYMCAVFSISDLILAISKATKKDVQALQKAHDLPHCPVKVFRLGDDFVQQAPLKPQLAVEPGEFLLCVGTVEARKNHQALYYMVREALNQGIDMPPIVIAGKHGWMVDDFIYLVKNDPVISQKIIFFHGGTDRELAWLFSNCKFTLYPSFYEGWGLPIAESLFYGKLCLASGVSSMPEIAGDLIDYYSPNDPAEMLDCTLKYLSNEKLLAQREDKIKKTYRATSWDETFKQVEKYILEN